MTRAELITTLTKEAEGYEHQHRHGSSVTSMAEDAAAFHTAKLIRQIMQQIQEIEL